MVNARLLRQSGLFAAVFLTVACSEPFENYQPPDAVNAELCSFDLKPSSNFAFTHIKYTGALLNGDISRQDYFDKGIDTIATAIAVPNNDRYRAEVRTDCYDPNRKVYFPCLVTANVDLKDIRGMARASTLIDAQRTAVYNCQSLTITRSAEALKRRLTESGELLCRVETSGFCDIPPPAGVVVKLEE
ncbi:MAG: hypothetical protein O3A96_08815 [Proteobacteria bacterium]|nr:hypothetical protein [Pseudomonadota bacterium]